MRTRNELYQAAMRILSARRQMAKAQAQDARAQAEAAVPELRAAEDALRSCGVRYALAGAQGTGREQAAAPWPWSPIIPVLCARTPEWPTARPVCASAGRCSGCAGKRSRPCPACR